MGQSITFLDVVRHNLPRWAPCVSRARLPSSINTELAQSLTAHEPSSPANTEPSSPSSVYGVPDPEERIMSEDELGKRFGERPLPRVRFLESARRGVVRSIRHSFPARKWLKSYGRAEARADLVAGLTTGIIMVPQGLAYAVLANLPPEYGLYSSMLPSVMYCLLGTSRELSLGPFALISLLVATALGELLTPEQLEDTSLVVGTAMGLSFFIGLFLLLLWLLRFGFVASFLSKSVLSGFTTGSAFLVATSQVKGAFGVAVERGSSFVSTWEQVFSAFAAGHANVCACLVTLFGLVFLLLLQVWNKSRAKHKQIPVPAEILLVFFTTLLTKLLRWDQKYALDIVGVLPSGFPVPTAPVFGVALVSKSAVIGGVIFIVSMSISLTFSEKNKYDVRANQELLAIGVANLIGSFFLCYPSCGSLSRSAVVDMVGARTPAHNLVSAALVALTLITLTHSLEYLPVATLSSIIFAALKSLFMQLAEPFRLARLSQGEALVWLLTFLSTVFLDTQDGILVGVVSSMTLLVYHVAYPALMELGRLPGTTIYRSTLRFPEAQRTPGVYVFHFGASLNFVNQSQFKGYILNNILKKYPSGDLKAIVIDASSIVFADVSSEDMLTGLLETLKKDNTPVQLYWAFASANLSKVLSRLGISHQVYVTIHDAVLSAQQHVISLPFDPPSEPPPRG
eukprot:g4269.t1